MKKIEYAMEIEINKGKLHGSNFQQDLQNWAVISFDK